MKIFTLFLLLFTTSSFADDKFSMDDFFEMSFEQQVQTVDAYREFLKTYSEKTEAAKFSSTRFSLFAEAWATGNFDCFYAGWPSRSSSKAGGGRLCSSPMTGNPDYRTIASSCGLSSLLCQPAIFGSGLCVSVATSALRNSAFQQCEQRFRDANRSTADVVREMNTPEKRADFQELVQVSDRVCRDGFQPGICTKLQAKIAAIREAGGTTLMAAVQTAVVVTDAGVTPGEVDCDPNTPGIQTTPPVRPTVVPQVPSTRILKRGCPRPPLSGAAPALPDITAQMAAENITVVAGAVSDTRYLSRFMEDFNKFPAPLRDEMKRNGSRVNLIFGRGVSEDPSWAAEAARSANPNGWQTTHDGRPWSEVPGSGGSLGTAPTPTRIVVNRLYEGHGASNLFLHEYGHTLDSMYGEHAITASAPWQQALSRDARSRDFIQAICGNYCNDAAHPEEAFAELFAYYHACSETNTHMKQFLPNVANFFDRLTNVRDLLDGKINMGDPIVPGAPVLAASEVRTQGTAITVSTGGTGNVSTGGVGPRMATVLPQSGQGSVVPPTTVARVPQGSSGGSSSGIATPNRILQMIASGELRYLGRGLLPGSDTVGSCVFQNAEVYVIVHACRRDGREAPAMNIDVITNDGQKINYYIENSEQTDRTVGMPSQVRRQNYDRSWRVTYQRPGVPPSPYSLESMRTYLQNVNVSSYCYTGGMSVSERDTLTLCSGNMTQYQQAWQQDADAFYTEPGEPWYGFLRSIRQKVQSAAGR